MDECLRGLEPELVTVDSRGRVYLSRRLAGRSVLRYRVDLGDRLVVVFVVSKKEASTVPAKLFSQL